MLIAIADSLLCIENVPRMIRVELERIIMEVYCFEREEEREEREEEQGEETRSLSSHLLMPSFRLSLFVQRCSPPLHTIRGGQKFAFIIPRSHWKWLESLGD